MQMPTLPHPTRCHRRRAQAGFTLVELVTVILILGVLAAVAMPRYSDLQRSARASKVRGVFGAVKAASALVKVTALTDGVSCAAGTGTNVSLEGKTIALNFCHAQALGVFGTGIFAAANVDSDDNWVVDGTNAGGATGGTLVQINLGDATTPASCSVRYTSAASATSPPVIEADTSGC